MGGATSSPKPSSTVTNERLLTSKLSTLTSITSESSSYGSIKSNYDASDVERRSIFTSQDGGIHKKDRKSTRLNSSH